MTADARLAGHLLTVDERHGCDGGAMVGWVTRLRGVDEASNLKEAGDEPRSPDRDEAPGGGCLAMKRGREKGRREERG